MADAVAVRPARVDWLYNFRQRQDAVPAKSIPLYLLFVATSRGEGGIERHSVQMAEHLAKRGVLITYACCPGGTLDRICVSKKIETYPLKACNSGDLLSVLTLTRLILRQSINVVHVHSRRDFVISVLAVTCVRFLRHPHGRLPVLVLHAHLLKNMGAPARLSGRFFERGAQAVIAVSEAVRTSLIATHRFRPTFVSLIHNGVDISRYELLPSIRRKCRKQMRQQWSIPKEDLVIGMIGRLNAKGQRVLLAVAAHLISRFSGVHFVFVGPEGETGVLVSLLQDAETAGIAAYVVFTGQSENIPMMLAGMDILAHLPEDEAFGLILVEAMAAGLPVVATDVGGCREVIEDGVTGLLVRVKDESSLTGALSFLLDPDAGPLRQRMGLAGQRRARQMFSLERQVESLEANYHDLLRDSA